MPVGEPGGPDTEVFYLFPHVEHDPAYGAHCHQNCDCGRFIELGNSVFMEYRRTETGFEPLPRRNVDYGGGLERIAAAAIDSPDVFRISLLRPIVERLEELSGRAYEDETLAMRVIADHLRGATFLAIDGVRPSNKAQGYVMRRLIRRAVRFAFDLGLQENFFPQIIPTVAGIYDAHYPEVQEHTGRRRRRAGQGGAGLPAHPAQGPQAAGRLSRHRCHGCRAVRPLRHVRLPGRALHRGRPPARHRRERELAERSSTSTWPPNVPVPSGRRACTSDVPPRHLRRLRAGSATFADAAQMRVLTVVLTPWLRRLRGRGA